MPIPDPDRKPDTFDPRTPHPFQRPTDDGIAALAPTGGRMGGQASEVAMTGAYMRTLGCAVPGCDKPQDDEIHAPAEE